MDTHGASDQVFHDIVGRAEKCGLGGFMVELRALFQPSLEGRVIGAVMSLVLFQHL